MFNNGWEERNALGAFESPFAIFIQSSNLLLIAMISSLQVPPLIMHVMCA
jgi:hypothetical protein